MFQQWNGGNPRSALPAGVSAFRAAPSGLVWGRFVFADFEDGLAYPSRPGGQQTMLALLVEPALPGWPADISMGYRQVFGGQPVTLWQFGDYYVRFARGARPGDPVYAGDDGEPLSGYAPGANASPWYVVSACGPGELALISTTTRIT